MNEGGGDVWSNRLYGDLGVAVRRHRDVAGLSAQELADRCSDLGYQISRSTLANLENGRVNGERPDDSRRYPTVSVAEVLVLARALGVSPLSLLLPAGGDVEVAPGLSLDADAARAWFVGAEPPRTITITVPAGAEVRMTS